MNRSIIITLTVFLAINTYGQILKADQTEFEVELFELCKTHYLFEDIIFDTSGLKQSSVWLSPKVWNNPKDTRKLVDSMMLLSEASALKEYKITVFGKPSLTNRIALIKVRPTGVDLDYSYVDAKQKFIDLRIPSWKTVDVLEVRGRTLFKGLHAD